MHYLIIEQTLTILQLFIFAAGERVHGGAIHFWKGGGAPS